LVEPDGIAERNDFNYGLIFDHDVSDDQAGIRHDASAEKLPRFQWLDG
jgi:hypothetical protein